MRPRLTSADRARVAQEVADDILGHGPLEPFLRDPEVSEIMVNGHDQIYVERYGRLYPIDAAFADEEHLRRTIDKIVARVGRRVDEASPLVDARLPDGSRVNAVVPPVALDGSLLTIRKFAADPFTVDDLIFFGTMTTPVAQLIQACVRGRLNIADRRRHRLRQDDHAQRALLLRARGRAHRHHRGRRRATAASGARDPDGVAATQHRGARRDRDPRPGAELAADAPGPDHHRRGPRRRRARHAAGHEHRPRRLASPPSTPTRRATRWPAWRRWC